MKQIQGSANDGCATEILLFVIIDLLVYGLFFKPEPRCDYEVRLVANVEGVHETNSIPSPFKKGTREIIGATVTGQQEGGKPLLAVIYRVCP